MTNSWAVWRYVRAFSIFIAVLFPGVTARASGGAPPGCDLYPIALSLHSLSNAAPGTVLNNIFNGAQPGNFGWLSWGGSPSEPALANSLTPPGNSSTYVNPDHPGDHQVSVGDWISGKPGVSNSKKVRDALDALKAIDITVPVWDQTRGCGEHAAYRVSSFARVRLISYQLPGENRITARFLGFTTCGAQNLAPNVNAGSDRTIVLPASATLNGVVSDDGLPAGGALTVTWSEVSGPGAVTLGNSHAAATTASFSAAGTYVLRLTASDSQLSSSDDAVVAVNRANLPPIASPQTIVTNEDTPAGISLHGSDPDNDPLSFSIVVLPQYGTLSGTPPLLLYTPKPDYNGPDSFQFKVNDGQFDSSNAVVSLQILPVNDPPVADPQSLTNFEDTTFPITLSGSDVEGSPLTYAIVDGPAHGTLNGAAPNLNYTPSPNYFGSDLIRFKVNDGTNDSAPAVVSIFITPVDDAPFVDVGPDQLIILPTNSVQLTGSITYDVFPGVVDFVEWTQLSGPGTATFSDPTNEVSAATFSRSGIYVLRLTAGDSFLTGSDEVMVTVDAPPVVKAGANQTNTLPASITLNGFVSDDGVPTNGALAVTWSKVSGAGPVVFADPGTTNTTASFSESGVYVLRLTADDGIVSTSSDVTVLLNRAPVVDAGSSQSSTNLQVKLNGTVFDDGLPGTVPLSVAWTAVSGAGSVNFSNAAAAATTAFFSAGGVYELRLTADDGISSNSATVTISINQAPVANAGPDVQAVVGNDILLQGSMTDDGLPNGILTATWSVVSSPGAVTIVTSNSPVTEIGFDTAGTYVLRLTASDSAAVGSDDVIITVTRPNQAPVVNAGPKQLVVLPSSASLNGSIADDGVPAGSSVVATWSKVSGPGEVSFAPAGASSASASFTQPGDYVLRLAASDTELNSFADVAVRVRTPAMNLPPAVSAGPDTIIGLTNIAALAGNFTDDGLPEGAAMTASWSLVSGPGTVTFDHSSFTNARAAFGAVGTYVLRLTANDSALSASDDVTISVYPSNQPPIVDAGPDQTVTIPDPALLVASGATPTNAGTELSISLSEVEHWNFAIGQPGLVIGEGVKPNSLDISDGRVYAAGDFMRAGDLPSIFWDGNTNSSARSLAMWDGTHWHNFYDPRPIALPDPPGATPGLQTGTQGTHIAFGVTECGGSSFCNEIFFGIAVRGSNVFAAASFKELAPVSDGKKDVMDLWSGTGWDEWGFKFDGSERPLVIEATRDKVYVAGGPFVFQTTNAIPGTFTNLAWYQGVVTWDGTNWGALAMTDLRGTNTLYVTSMVVTNDNVYVAGLFLLPTPTGIATNVARWDGHQWRPLGTGVPGFSQYGGVPPTALALGENGDLYLGGPFTNIGGVTAHNIARWDGVRWWPLTFGADEGVNGVVQAIVTHGRDVFAAGQFSVAGGVPAWRFAKWDGQIWLGMGKDANSSLDGTPFAMAVDDSGVYLGGDFSHVSNSVANRIIEWEFPKRPSREVHLNGLVTDDGLPTGAPLTSVWTTVSGPGDVRFADPNSRVTTATFSKAGQYVLRLIASDTDLTGFDEVTINVRANEAPVIDAGPDYLIGLNEPLALNGSVSDDGLPQGAPVYHVWKMLYGPGQVTFDHPDQTNVIARFSVQGIYVLRLYANDSQFTASDDVTVVVRSPQNQAPSVFPGSSATITLGSTRKMDAAVSDDGFPTGVTNYSWSVVSGPGMVTFDNANTINPVVSFSTNGVYVLQLAANDSELTTVASSTTTVSLPNNNPPIVNAGPDQTISDLFTTLQGTVSDDSFPPASALNIFWSRSGSSGTVTFANSNSLTTAVTFSQPGTYSLILNANDGVFPRSDTMVVTVAKQPPVVNAGPDRAITLPTNKVQLAGMVFDLSPFSVGWSTISGPGAVTFTPNSVGLTSSATFSTNGTYLLRLTATDSSIGYTDDLTVVVAPAGNQPPTVDAGPDQILSLPDSLTLPGAVSDDGLPFGTVISQWSLVSGPGAVTFSPAATTNAQPVTTATFGTNGTYVLRLSATDTVLTNGDDVIVTVKLPQNSAPLVNAGPDFTTRVTNTITLNGSVTDDALPAGGRLTTFWNKLSGPGVVTFGSPNAGAGAGTVLPVPTSAAFSLPGIYVLRLIADDAELAGSDSVTITVLPAEDDQAPIVNAGPDTTAVAFALQQLNGSVSDDGLPPGSPLNANWGVISGPARVYFSDAHSLKPFAQFSAVGTYVLRLTVNDNRMAGSDDVTITVNTQSNEAPFVFAGLPQQVTRPAPALLEGLILDDGLPLGFPLTAAWNKVSGPGAVTFSPDANDPLASASFGAAGDYVLRLTAGDSQLTNFDEVTITVFPGTNAPPVVNAGPDFLTVLSISTALHTEVTDDGLEDGTLEISWSKVSGPGDVYFNTVNGAYYAGFGAAGDYVLRLTADDGSLTNSDDVAVTVYDAPPPIAEINLPQDGQIITSPTNIIGTASSDILQAYRLEYRLKPLDETIGNRQSAIGNWTALAQGTNSIQNGSLGILDTTLSLNGLYELRLTATDILGRSATTDPITVIFDRNLKIGQFTISFTDLAVPVPGLPLQITRTYDSRAAAAGIQGDFGIGWTMDLRNVRLQKNRPLGRNWVETTTGNPFDLTLAYHLNPVNARIVTITFPDGRVEKFQFDPKPLDQPLLPIGYPQWHFTPLDNTRGTLVPAGYDDPDGSFLFFFGSIPGTADLVDLNYFFDVLNSGLNGDDMQQALERYPTLFRYTSPEGTRYLIDEVAGLQSVTDPNGNTLLIGTNGLTWTNPNAGTNSLSIVFQRDAAGRITNIVDAAGQVMSYSYDTNGNLVTFTDRTGQTNGFAYTNVAFPHHLTGIADPRGITPVRNEYDADGRLIGNLDAFGKAISYGHDLANHLEYITNRLGFVTVSEYDDHGNVVRMVDPLGAVTLSSYDQNGNVLQTIDPLGRTNSFTYDALDNRLTATDPLGNTTRFTYSELRRVTSVADPRGKAITNVFDGQGNLLSMRDPLGNVTLFAYNNQGLPVAMTNALGQVMSFDYDQQGRLVNEKDAVGHGTDYQRDANGNLLRQTTTRTKSSAGVPPATETLTVQFFYDAQSRLTNSVFPDGSSAQTIYNAIGQPAVAIDQLGRQTAMEYDQLGRVTRTIYPDGSSEASGYDAEGRRTSSTNRLGQVTQYDYDGDGRLFRSVMPDGTSSINYLDLAGQLIVSTDARGANTFYGYDDAGRSVTVTNALGQVSRSAYDAGGNVTNAVDALGRSTRFIYDPLNRRVQTIFADGTTQQTFFDVLGRRTHEQDQAGKVTAFTYDTLGRLTAVTNALGYVTSYAYDELGQQISQTDANNHTTTFEYDSLGRRVKRTLPGNQVETYAYNIGGLLTNRTDFDGYVTMYHYDLMNRLLAKVPDARRGEPSVTFGYNVLGLRTNMTDAAGSTSYQYDERNRLVQKARTWNVGQASSPSLNYSYDANGNLTNIVSSDPNGVDVGYEYDALNRLSAVNDAKVGRTAYNYDDVGNLQSYSYPNGVSSVYQYDALNRLTNLASGKVLTSIAQYAYTVGASGNRLTASERLTASAFNAHPSTINRLYTYDDVYRLTGETINVEQASSLSLNYAYDPVGNRLTRNSTVPTLPFQSFSFDANDRLTSDQYDANGNTLFGAGFGQTQVDQYDFENRLISRRTSTNTITIQYDGDGNRVSKTVGTATNSATTFYVVDDLNPSGYAQVLEEHVSLNPQPSTLNRVYSYGHTLISQDRLDGATWRTSFYGYDGHNNVRYLTDLNGFVTDTYDYDAFGNLISRTGDTPNSYLFTGEQYDTDLGLYYLRARYHNPDTGRFWTMDEFEGAGSDPVSLHKYTYCGSNAINAYDPSGNFSLVEMAHSSFIGGLTTAIVGSLARAAGAASAGAGFRGSLDAANNGIAEDFASGAIGGALGYGFGKVAFWALGKAAPYLMQYTPTFVMAFNKATAQLGRAWQTAEAAWARLENTIVQGSEAAINSAQVALIQARVAISKLSNSVDELGARSGFQSAATRATQLEFALAEEYGGTSGLVIGRGRVLSLPNSLRPGEYRLTWLTTLPEQDATLAQLEREWLVNMAKLQNVMKLNLPIRDASPLSDMTGFFLNRERDLLRAADWTYNNGYWVPPTL